MSEEKLLFGTKEWAPHNFNFVNGCSNDCVYCYAKEMAVRFKRKTPEGWKEETPVSLDKKSFAKRNGPIMIPSSHDITPANVGTAISVISRLLDNGNELLVVTKPDLGCIRKIADRFRTLKDSIKFRFTMGSSRTEVLKLWEPGAPGFEQRLDALSLAFAQGYSTSVSCEPLLDADFDNLYRYISPFVTDSIWVGKMNMASKRVRVNTSGMFPAEVVEALLASQTDERIINLYDKYRHDPVVRWKESIKKVLISHGLC